jgi:outer membrane protein assembly factor BamB
MNRWRCYTAKVTAGVIALCAATFCCEGAEGITNSGWPFRAEGEIFSLPFCDGSNLYFGACDGNFYCVNKASAALEWKRDGFVRIDSGPVERSGLVYFASIDDQLHAFSARDGSTKWSTSIKGVGYQNPKVHGDAILITGDNQLVELNRENGQILRHYDFKGEGGELSWNSVGVAVVANQNASSDNYRGEGSLSFFKFGIDSARWTTKLGGSCRGQVGCDEDRCYLGARDGNFSAFDASRGTVAWRINCSELFGRRRGMVWADQHVVTSTSNGSVIFTACHQVIGEPSLIVCAAKGDGRVLWKVEHPTQVCGSFELVDKTVIAVTQDRKIVTVDIDTGQSRVADLLPKMDRGEFAGVKRDGDFLFVAGADARVWRLGLEEMIGKRMKVDK